MYKIDNLSEIEEQYRKDKEEFLAGVEELGEALTLNELIISLLYEDYSELIDAEEVEIWNVNGMVAKGHWYEGHIRLFADSLGTARRERDGAFRFRLLPREACA